MEHPEWVNDDNYIALKFTDGSIEYYKVSKIEMDMLIEQQVTDIINK